MAKNIFIELSNLQLFKVFRFVEFLPVTVTVVSDVAVLSKNLDQLTSLKTEVNKLKNKVVAMDQGLFDKSGTHLSPGEFIHHDFNSATVNKLNELGQNASAFMAQVDEKLKELQSTFKGLVLKPSTSKARKRKQNKKRGIKRKLTRMENAKNKSSAKGFTKGQP